MPGRAPKETYKYEFRVHQRGPKDWVYEVRRSHLVESIAYGSRSNRTLAKRAALDAIESDARKQAAKWETVEVEA